MLESLTSNNLEYQKLTKDEMSRRGILGRLVGACADIINPTRNGRKYSEKLWENVFEDPIMKERIENGVCYGELGHPADREETDMEKIAVCLAEVPKKGSDGKLRAVFDILNTPNGRILKSLCDYGSTLGISSRGSGDLEVGFDGQEAVNPDTYNCEGFDIVLIPAVKDARLEYVTESLDKKRYNKTLREKLTESINKETEDHQKIMKESLNTLGIDLNEAKEKFIICKVGDNKYALGKGNPPIINERKTIEANSYEEAKDILIDNGYSSDELVFESYTNTDEATEFIRDQELNEDTYTEDELWNKFGTTDLDIINAGNEETVTLKDDKNLNESVWDKIAQIINEDADTEILDEALSPEEKMDLWHNGERRENIKACGDDKLEKYLEICKDKGYDEQVAIIEDEINRRKGTSDKLEVKMSDDKSELYIKVNDEGRELCLDVAKVLGITLSEFTKDFTMRRWGGDDSDWLVIEKSRPFSDIVAKEIVKRLSKKDESLNINEEQEAGDIDTALVDELQEALKLNRVLDEKIVNLQKQLSASNAQEMKLNEEIDNLKIKVVKLSDKAKTNKALTEKLSKLENKLKESTEAVTTKRTALRETIRRDANERKTLQEAIESKDNEIAELQKQLTEANHIVSEKEDNVNALNEQLETVQKDARQIKEKYVRKLEEKDSLIEKYKKIAKTAVDNYIDSKATVLGISSNEIKNRLPESYSFKDINEVCDDLREYNINMNSLPFSTNKLNEGVNFAVKNPDSRTLITNEDDDISDTDIKLAEKFMR